MPKTGCLALILLSAVMSSALSRDTSGTHVRCLTTGSRALLDSTLDQSSLARAFVEEIEHSDVVVYVAMMRDEEPQSLVRGSTGFMTAAAGTRFLLVRVNAKLPAREQAAVLGHELWHVLEVVRAPGVRDEAAFRQLYARIGSEWRAGRFETPAAHDAECRIRAGLASGRSRHAGGS